MASDKEYLDFVLEQLSGADGITYRAMMGEYIIYCRGKVIGGIYDDRFLVKPTQSAKRLLPDAAEELPYDGAKPMLLVGDLDSRELLCELVSAVADDLPDKK
ncbi:MAG: TfoX/Sxy family protein [Ruminococcaceae bacterium]|nr:TfoX/Sxy family protein [Oscillospiraceae bacterium]